MATLIQRRGAYLSGSYPTPSATLHTHGDADPQIEHHADAPINGPKGGHQLECLNEIGLRWNAVSDASGIAICQVRPSISHIHEATYSDVDTAEVDSGTPVNISGQNDCGNLMHWRVRARDNTGNR